MRPLNPCLAYATTGFITQGALYNRLIADVYQYHGVTLAKSDEPVLARMNRFIWTKLYPGFVYSFLREGFASGAGLVVGPLIRERIVKPAWPELEEKSPFLLRF